MKTMFRTDEFSLNKIEELEVIRKTDKTIWYKYKNWKDEICESSERITSSYKQWFNTDQEAESHVICRLNTKLTDLNKQIEILEDKKESIEIIYVNKIEE